MKSLLLTIPICLIPLIAFAQDATTQVSPNVDLPTIKKLMGHSKIETTMIYSHLADEHVDRAVEKLIF